MQNAKVIDFFDGKWKYLSNFYGGPIIYNCLKYGTVEAAFQAQKTLLKNVQFEFTLMTASQAKRAGRKVLLRRDWNEVKDKIMEDLVRLKFQIPKYREVLLSTGDAELVEGNWWKDTYWGVCAGIGHNKLGKILMKIRSELRRS